MTSYGQFCPVAKAMEVLDERWTLLIVREMLLGSTHFNELRRGVPKMSPALLSKRLRSLERAGIVHRQVDASRTGYTLTKSGTDLLDVVNALGLWGLRWIPELGDEDLDPHLLFWDIQRTIPVDRWPRERTVVAFEFPDVPVRSSRWWLVVTGEDVDVCDADPGYEVTATARMPLRLLARIWRGEERWHSAEGRGDLVVAGSSPARRGLPEWIGQSAMATLAAAR
ncbi:MAG: helix-turn-helix transcriptional regulator [Intrasporangium sp.]|uniref:winged helix-turn-helix transcriptional regulator n=1 Tax=Intrasporangium sp. TaxID=1925024 RepID=UPI0026498334|nr:helix-turn-helix domain-containing protein [Intrasporangium sp.]MDN5794490.1 helix-turn-helix transcriptional regulator [Intrasporangium sp.]